MRSTKARQCLKCYHTAAIAQIGENAGEAMHGGNSRPMTKECWCGCTAAIFKRETVIR